MKVIIFGASGMIGHGAVRACLLADDVTDVLVVGRKPLGRADLAGSKVKELVHDDFTDFTSRTADFAPFDACLFCLGVSSAGMSEAEYAKVTHDYTLAAARAMPKTIAFVYVSGAGTDSSEQGTSMWARVKGKTENALLAMFPGRATMFRPGGIRPVHGATSKTLGYRIGYTVAWPLLPIAAAAGWITTTDKLGRAMLQAARGKAGASVLENAAINQLGAT